MSKNLKIGAGVLAVACAAVLWTWSSRDADAPPPVADAGAVATAGASAASQPGRWTPADADAAGLRFDAARLFDLGYAGGLVIDQNTRVALEAVMGSMSDSSSEAELAKIEKALREGMPRAEADRAVKLVRGYRDYVSEVKTQMLPMGIPSTLQDARAFFNQMDAIRGKHFDAATASAVFGPHDGYARITMEASFVAQDATLSLADKKAQLDALRAKLPADQRSLIAEPEEAAPAESAASKVP